MNDSPFTFSESSEFRKFCELSADSNRNPLLVQGAGGNTSIKEDGLLWVKASGTWLSEATEKNHGCCGSSQTTASNDTK